jgi:electron transfer flavoprotein alpha subunit
MAVLVLADVDQGKLTAATARIVGAAAQLGEVHVLVAVDKPGGPGLEAAKLSGVTQVVAAGLSVLAANPDAGALVALLEKLAPDYTHIVAGATAQGRDVIPRLAARLDIMPVTDVVEILGPNRFIRPIYAGNALETVASGQPRQILTVRASAFRPAQVRDDGASLNMMMGEGGVTPAAQIVGEERSESTRPELSTAQIVVSGGIPLGDRLILVENLAEMLGAAVGATRALVDAGHAPNDLQVGQTGKIVAPDLYIGVGISGALQHLAGIQGAKAIFAINKDPEAPLMKIADVALVGDLFEAVPAVIAELDKLGLKR